MMNLAELRAEARKSLAGNWNWAALLTFLTAIISCVVGLLQDDLGNILFALLSISLAYTFLDLADDGTKESNYFTAIFSAFTRDRILPVFINWLLSTIFICLWSLLLIVPGIIKTLAYSQSQFIVKDMVDSGQEVDATEAIRKSRQLMNGHKGEYFLLQLTFIGWAMLGCLSLGIGFLWISPYIRVTNAKYYRKLAGDQFLNSSSHKQRTDDEQDQIEATSSFGNK